MTEQQQDLKAIKRLLDGLLVAIVVAGIPVAFLAANKYGIWGVAFTVFGTLLLCLVLFIASLRVKDILTYTRRPGELSDLEYAYHEAVVHNVQRGFAILQPMTRERFAEIRETEILRDRLSQHVRLTASSDKRMRNYLLRQWESYRGIHTAANELLPLSQQDAYNRIRQRCGSSVSFQYA